jgi:hypothetical protein
VEPAGGWGGAEGSGEGDEEETAWRDEQLLLLALALTRHAVSMFLFLYYKLRHYQFTMKMLFVYYKNALLATCYKNVLLLLV